MSVQSESVAFQSAFGASTDLSFSLKRAQWLGRCAEAIYPMTDEEIQADQLAARAKAAVRQQSRRWWQFTKPRISDADYENLLREAELAKANVLNTESARISRQFRAWGFTNTEFLSSKSTQCCIATSDVLTVICFRGTESNRIADIYADLMALPVSKEPVPGLLHKGFHDALTEIWGGAGECPEPDGDNEKKRSKATLDSEKGGLQNSDLGWGLTDVLLKQRESVSKSKPPALIWITGHSLGGALATLTAARLLAESVVTISDIGGIYTFGQPRVADDQFRDAYPVQSRHFRVIHSNDVVTRVPPESLRWLAKLKALILVDRASWLTESKLSLLALYRHVGRQVHITKRDGVISDVGPWSLFQRRLLARMISVQSGKTFAARFMPGLGDHSMARYNLALQSSVLVTDDINANVKASSLNEGKAALAGLLLGLLVGVFCAAALQNSLTQAAIVSVAIPIVALTLDERFLLRPYAIALGSFGFAGAIALALSYLYL